MGLKLDNNRYKFKSDTHTLTNGNNPKPTFRSMVDSFSNKNKQKADKSNNNKFDKSQALKNFCKGIISPLTALIKHPVLAIGMIAGTVALTTLAPVLTPVLTVSFGAYSLYQVGKGTYDAIKNYKQGNFDDSEKSFDKIGQGFISTVLSALGIKQTAKIAKEAKMMNDLKVDALTTTQKENIANSINNDSFFNAIRENVSLLTTKNGLKSITNQFRPSMMKRRTTDIFNKIKGNNKVEETREIHKTVKKEVEKTEYRVVKSEDFCKTPEGIRRAALTDKQIEKEVQIAFDEAFDKMGVPKELRPKLVVHKGGINEGGSYMKNAHRLTINSEGYRYGSFELEETVMHEVTHCKEALLRAGIPQHRVNEIVKQELISRIMKGENEEILVNRFFYAETMTPPKMSPKMCTEFAEFAKAELLKDEPVRTLDRYLHHLNKNDKDIIAMLEAKEAAKPLLNKLTTMIKNNPEFVNQYSSNEEALKMLIQYSTSHNYRYRMFTDVEIPIQNSSGTYIKVPELTGYELLKAEKSLINNIPTIEGNARMQTISSTVYPSAKDFNQYQFSPEEVLAQQNGNKFLIEKQIAKLSQMRANGNLNPAEEFRLQEIIRRAEAIIEYKTKGLEYYKQYNKMINNPTDKTLQIIVDALEIELNKLKNRTQNFGYIKEPYKVTRIEEEIVTELIRVLVDAPIVTTAIPKETIYNILAILNGKKQSA